MLLLAWGDENISIRDGLCFCYIYTVFVHKRIFLIEEGVVKNYEIEIFLGLINLTKIFTIFKIFVVAEFLLCARYL